MERSEVRFSAPWKASMDPSSCLFAASSEAKPRGGPSNTDLCPGLVRPDRRARQNCAEPWIQQVGFLMCGGWHLERVFSFRTPPGEIAPIQSERPTTRMNLSANPVGRMPWRLVCAGANLARVQELVGNRGGCEQEETLNKSRRTPAKAKSPDTPRQRY